KGAVEDGKLIPKSDIVDSQPNGYAASVPEERLGDRFSSPPELAVKVELCRAFAASETSMSNDNLGPDPAPEGRLGDGDEPGGESRVLVARKVGGVPGLQIPEHTQAEMARLIVSGEVHPDG